MAKTPVTFVIYYFGAVTLWILGGFKGKISSYLPGPYEQSKRRTKALIAGILSTFLIFILVYRFVDYYESSKSNTIPGLTPEQTRRVRELQNKDGTITLTPEQIEKGLKKIEEKNSKGSTTKDTILREDTSNE
jgi:hypothetical protein